MKLSAIVVGAMVCLGLALPATAGEITLTVVNIETPQGVKIWEPASARERRWPPFAISSPRAASTSWARRPRRAAAARSA